MSFICQLITNTPFVSFQNTFQYRQFFHYSNNILKILRPINKFNYVHPTVTGSAKKQSHFSQRNFDIQHENYHEMKRFVLAILCNDDHSVSCVTMKQSRSTVSFLWSPAFCSVVWHLEALSFSVHSFVFCGVHRLRKGI